MFNSIFRGLSPRHHESNSTQDNPLAQAHERMLFGLQANLPQALKKAQLVGSRERIDGDFLARVTERATALRAIDGLPAKILAEIDRMERFAKNTCEDITFATNYGPVLYRHVDAQGEPLAHAEPIGTADLRAHALFGREVVLTMPTVEMVQQLLASPDGNPGQDCGEIFFAQERHRMITLMVDAAPAGTPLGQVVRQAALLEAMCEEHERSPDTIADEGEFVCTPVLVLENQRHFDALNGEWVVVLMKDGQIVADTLGQIEASMLRIHRVQDAANWQVLRRHARLRKAEETEEAGV